MAATGRVSKRTICGLITVLCCCFTPLVYAIASSELSALHHDLTLSLVPAEGSIEAEDRVQIEGAGEISFYLSPQLEIKQALLDGKPVAFTQDGDRWHIDLGSAGKHRLQLSYSGRFPSEATTANGQSARTPILSAAYGYFPSGSGWYPQFNHGPFTYTLSITLPIKQQAIAPGKRAIDESTKGSNAHTVRYAFAKPTWELPLFVGPYDIQQQNHGRYEIRTLFFKGMESLHSDYLNLSQRYIDLFEQRIGPYPFDRFDIVAAKMPVGWGFAGITYIGESVLQLPFIKYSSLGHEILHNWWGNGVYVDYQNGNWAEGLTTYMADYHFVEQRSADAARLRRLEWLRDYNALPPERDRPVRSFTGKTHAASQVIGYNKVAFTFHMLRQQLGEERFNKALQQFWQDKQFQMASWGDLEMQFSNQAGQDLGDFFAQWLDRTGAPDLSVSHVAKTLHSSGNWKLSLAINQSDPAYRLQVPIRILTSQGTEEHMVEVTGAQTPIELELQSEPSEIALDPDFHLFRRLGPNEAPAIMRDTLLNDRIQVIVLGDEVFKQEALALAGAMSDAGIEPVGSPANGKKPFLVIGLDAEVDLFLQRNGLPSGPDELAGDNSARAWALRTALGQPYIVVSADSLEALQSIKRPLPHYGRRSYVGFKGRKAVVKGTWPLERSGIRVQLD